MLLSPPVSCQIAEVIEKGKGARKEGGSMREDHAAFKGSFVYGPSPCEKLGTEGANARISTKYLCC